MLSVKRTLTIGLLCLISSAAQASSRVLKRVIDIHSLTNQEAAEGSPVEVRGIVTQVMPEWSGFSFQDATDAVYVLAEDSQAPIPSIGQYLEIHGHTASGNFAPIIVAVTTKLLGQKKLPRPPVVDWKILSSGTCDNDYVAMRGVVRSIAAVRPPRWAWRATAMHIDLGGNLIWAYVRDSTGLPTTELTGATVLVRGTCVVLSNGHRQFESNALLVANSAAVGIAEKAPVDPFSLPLSDMNQLFVFQRRGPPQPHEVRVQGAVTWAHDTRIFLQSDQSTVQVQIAAPVPVSVGQCIEAVGFPSAGEYSTILEDAVVRRCTTPRQVTPLDVRASEVLGRGKDYRPVTPDGMLVRITGSLLDVSWHAGEEVLTLQDGETVFSARLARRFRKEDTATVAEGSLVTFTGVCAVQIDEIGLPRSFELLLRSPTDIRIVNRPSWITRTVALKIAGVLLAAACLATLWIILLRMRVRSQTVVIDEQLKREAALEKRVRALVEHASDMVYMLDAQGNLLHVNYGAERLTGYSRQELLKLSFFELLVPEQRDLARQVLADDKDRQQSGFAPREWRFLTKDGGEVTVEINQRLQAGPDGQVRIEAIGRDVTARKRAMFEYQERFRTLADNIPQLAWIADADGSVVWYNQRWFEYTGGTLDEARGWGWQMYHHPDHVERVVSRVRHCFEAGERWEDTFPLRAADGQFRWFLGRAVPIRDVMGRVARWFGTNTDITEHKWIEAELQRSNADLVQFAYIASHDLQEPLRNIGSFAQLLARTFQNGDLSPQRSQYIEVIISSVRRMESLIRDLLAYSRVTGTHGVERPPTDLQMVFNTVIENLQTSIRQSNATVTHDPLPTINANPVHIAQVLQNLLGNAIKYRRPDIAPAVHFGAGRQVDGWLFSVRDNGSGFEPQYADRIFGIFKRLHGREMPGTGIGLAICKAIVERYGGRIWAEAQRGAGATFYFTIPDSGPSSEMRPGLFTPSLQ